LWIEIGYAGIPCV